MIFNLFYLLVYYIVNDYTYIYIYISRCRLCFIGRSRLTSPFFYQLERTMERRIYL